MSAETLKVYKRAAAAADKKVAAAELAFDSDPSAENTSKAAGSRSGKGMCCEREAREGGGGGANVLSAQYIFCTQSLVHTCIMHRERVHRQLQLILLIWASGSSRAERTLKISAP